MDKQSIFGQNKLLNHPDRILSWLQGGDETLVTVEMDLTNICNNRCPRCIGWAGRKTQDSLAIDEVQGYLIQVFLLGAKGIIFTGGGEPLLHRGFVDALWMAKELGLHIGLITNGLLMPDRAITAIMGTCDWVRVSLDAGSPETYERTHGMNQGRWLSVVNNLSRLVLGKKVTESSCTIGVGYLTGEGTASYNDMEQFIRKAAELGVDYAQFRPFHNDFTDVREIIEALAVKYGRIVTASWQKYNRFSDQDKRPYKQCHGAHFATVIGANGDMFVCCHMRGIDKYKLGSLRTQTMESIWKNRQVVFDRIDFNDCPPFCRCDEFNRLLDEISKPKEHIEFI